MQDACKLRTVIFPIPHKNEWQNNHPCIVPATQTIKTLENGKVFAKISGCKPCYFIKIC